MHFEQEKTVKEVYFDVILAIVDLFSFLNPTFITFYELRTVTGEEYYKAHALK